MRKPPVLPLPPAGRPPQSDIVVSAYAHISLGLIALAFGVPPAEILSLSRRAPTVFARQTAMYLLHVVLRISPRRIGRAFKRDRTTTEYAIRVIEDARDFADIDACIETCTKSLRSLPELEPPSRRLPSVEHPSQAPLLI